uniref:GAF domain-containing protein n=1 Tax=Thermosporothrix sp. COM3 TaxID=2490863 RepID=A0A455SYL8_9CHLR|nr:hypothetical protein KTC_59560 [Thermosporothrix sp. COM3]
MGTSLQPWMKVLQGGIKSPAERRRLAQALHVAPMTLTRWANGESQPNRQHLARLAQVAGSSYRQDLLSALQAQYPDFQNWLMEGVSSTIPSAFFARVLRERTMTTESLIFWRLSELILEQALEQLDPQKAGMAVRLILCMPPREDGNVWSLRQCLGRGVHPWKTNLEHEVLFLGYESLSGYAIHSGQLRYDNDLHVSNRLFPAIRDKYEFSAAAYPLRFEGNIAGCLLASSHVAQHFNETRLALLATFGDLLSLALTRREDFYPPSRIALKVMPEPARQEGPISTFRQRVTRIYQRAAAQHQAITAEEAEMEAWKEIEYELLTLP